MPNKLPPTPPSPLLNSWKANAQAAAPQDMHRLDLWGISRPNQPLIHILDDALELLDDDDDLFSSSTNESALSTTNTPPSSPSQ